MEPFATETLTIGGTASGLTAATYAGAISAYITIETNSIRWWATGDTPTSSAGHLAQPGDHIQLPSLLAIQRFKAIRTASPSATIQVTYYR